MSSYRIHTDGGSRGNPGPSAIGVVVYKDDSPTPVYEQGATIGIGTNNRAEYTAVIEALKWVTAHPDVTAVHFFLDSLLVVQQLKGVYKVKHPDIIPLHAQVQSLRSSLPFSITFTHVERAKNAMADALVNRALDAEKGTH